MNMMRTTHIAAGMLAAGLILAGCARPSAGAPQGAQAGNSISGRVTYDTRAALPDSAIINIALQDQTDAGAKPIAAQIMKADGQQSPFPFELDYQASQLKAGHAYVLTSTITIQGAPAYVLPAPQPVDAFSTTPISGVELALKPVQNMAPSTEADPLKGTSWQLSEVDAGGVATVPVEGTTITLVFGSDGTVSGSSGCNTYNGEYRLSAGEQIVFLNLASTMKACDEAVMKQEMEYLRLLGTGGVYFLNGNRLKLEVDKSKSTLLFGAPGTLAAQSPTSSPLSNTGWDLVTIVSAGVEQAVNASAKITLDLSGDGQASGSDGCNQYSGTYTTNGDQITFGPLASTMKACDEAVMKQAATYLQHLQTAEKWRAEGNVLELTTKDGQHVLRYQRKM